MTSHTYEAAHDPVWRLHHERLATDERNQQPPERRKYGYQYAPDVLRLHPDDPAEHAAALRTAHQIARRAQLDDAALGEVLQALGLAPYRQPTQTPPAPARARGRCRYCHQKSIPLRKKTGLLCAHGRAEGQRWADNPCPGTGTPPAAARKATAA